MLSSCCCESVISLSSCVFVSSRCCIDSNISFDSVSLRIVSQILTVWTAGITRSVCGVATFVGGGKSFSSSCSAVRWRVSVLLDGAGRISNVLAKIDGEVSVGGGWMLSTVDVLVMAGGVFFGA